MGQPVFFSLNNTLHLAFITFSMNYHHSIEHQTAQT